MQRFPFLDLHQYWMFLVDFASLLEHKDYLDFNFSFNDFNKIYTSLFHFIFAPMTENLSIFFLSLHTLKSN